MAGRNRSRWRAQGSHSGSRALSRTDQGAPGRFPDHAQGLDGGRLVERRPPLRRPRGTRGRSVEHPDRMLAVIAGHLTDLIQNLPLLRTPGMPITLIDSLHILLPASRTTMALSIG